MSEKIRNEHDVLINVVELASEFAHSTMKNNWDYRDGEIYIEEDGETRYTETAQDIFNELYDTIYDSVIACKSNSNSISVDILSYEEDGQKVYDIEHMVDDFANKLNELQPDGISLEIFYS